ncbi:MAG: ABC transporter permease [Pseudomonadota bacterium]
MSPDIFLAIAATIVTAATPLLIAALGELVVERSGVLNLGVEGMMIVGAVMAFAGAQWTGSAYAGLALAIVAGMAMASLFALLVLIFRTNQVVTGLALTIFGLGLSGLIGQAFIGFPGVKLQPVLFGFDILVYASLVLTAGIAWFLFRTRTGLILRAVGDNHTSAHAIGHNVIAVRLLAILFGGACAGAAGAYLSLAYTPQWVEGMTAGRGWIALALVVFATWRPVRVLVGAYLFGTVLILQFHAQALGVQVPSQLLNALPYLATIFVLVLISANSRLVQRNTPQCLGKPFAPDV